MDKWITVEQVAIKFGFNPKSVLNAIYHQRVQARRDGRRWLILAASAYDRWNGILLHERGQRQCRACERVLPLHEFLLFKGRKRRRMCKTCWRQQKRSYLNAWRHARKYGN